MKSNLLLPTRPDKPRDVGITSILDNGIPLTLFEDYLKSYGNLIDYLKFGWGTAVVTPCIQEKIEACQRHDVKFYFGGTLFERYYHSKQVDDFVDLCHQSGCKHIEVSNGTIDLGNDEKAKFIRDLSQDFTVFSEVGYKDNRKSIHMPPSKWIDYILQDLDAGADKVITESRESGTSGICRENGELRFGLIEDIMAHVTEDRLIFEAPNKRLQTFFIRKVGVNVNLGNIAFSDLISLETLRLGLRSDTLLDDGHNASD